AHPQLLRPRSLGPSLRTLRLVPPAAQGLRRGGARRPAGLSGGTQPMKIAEFFQSIQGEGEFAGTPSVFVRTTGCNLRCWFCDTPYTSWEPEGTHEAWQALAERILACDCQHGVL